MSFILAFLLSVVPAADVTETPASAPAVHPVSKASGYHGIWYANQPMDTEYRYKYGGGLGTYCAKHLPIAYYAEQADKTFFVYGGTRPGTEKRTLLAMVSCYDHKTGTVPQPTLLIDKHTDDAHDNPSLMLDDKGHVWVFVAAHGTARPSYIFRSIKPYDIDAFERVQETNFSYPQPWYVPEQGFLFLHTRYVDGLRQLFDMTSPDGRKWSEPRLLAAIEKGHYQISGRYKNKIGTAFNMHPSKGGLNARTNLYYIESDDFGKTWRTARKRPLKLPLKNVRNEALIRDYAAEDRLVYLKDLTFDRRGNPVILYLTSRGFEPGPQNNPRFWTIARWTGREWLINGQIRSDNNYDTGCLYLEKRDLWRIIGPTDTGPQPFNTGGEMVMWTTDDQGRSWHKQKLTTHSQYNHSYARRPVNAHEDFYALWADGHGREPSESRLYFTNKQGQVFMLPTKMDQDHAKPIPVPLMLDAKEQ